MFLNGFKYAEAARVLVCYVVQLYSVLTSDQCDGGNHVVRQRDVFIVLIRLQKQKSRAVFLLCWRGCTPNTAPHGHGRKPAKSSAQPWCVCVCVHLSVCGLLRVYLIVFYRFFFSCKS